MRWLIPTLVGSCVALWIDALAGGGVIGGVPALAFVAALSLAAGVRVELVPLLVATLASAALLSVADQVYEPGRFALASDGVFYCVVVGAPALVGSLIGRRNRQVVELRRRRHTLEIRRTAAVRAARARERDRVERRIDLSLADRLRRISSDATAANRLAVSDPDGVPGRLDSVEQTARDALAELRDLLGFLQRDGAGGTRDPVPSAAPPAERSEPVRARHLDPTDLALVLAAVPLAIETALPGHHGPAAANVVTALLQGVALLVVRRRPMRGVVLLVVVASVQTAYLSALPPTVGWLLPGLLAAFLIGRWPTRLWSWAGLCLLVAGTVVVTLATPAAHRSSAGIVPGLVMGLLSWIGGRMVAEREARAGELSAIADELDRTRPDAARVASAEQRAEMARDLHDAGAHALTVVCLQAGAARTWWDRDRDQARVALEALTSVTDGTLAHVGRSLDGLARADAAGPLEPASLDVLAGIGRALGLEVELAVAGHLPPVGDDVARVVYLVVQEALTNAARHAFGTTVRVSLTGRDTAHHAMLEVRITDTGPAAAATLVPTGGPGVTITGAESGLRGMRERVEGLRGELTTGPRGPGFEVLARLPA